MTGVAGGITETICLVRCKGRFGRPTSGGWADIMMNLHFEDDTEWAHVCEIQLVHAELYSVRKNMGAHGSYTEFRAASELCEKIGVDPEEEGSDAGILDALAWTPPGQQQKIHASEMPTAFGSSPNPESHHCQLLALIQGQNERFLAQNERFLAQNERLQAQNERLLAQNETQSETMTALELQISFLCAQHERFEHDMSSKMARAEKQNEDMSSQMKHVCEQLEQSPAASF